MASHVDCQLVIAPHSRDHPSLPRASQHPLETYGQILLSPPNATAMKTKNTKHQQRPLHPLLKPPSIIAILHYTVSLLLPQLPSPSFLASSSSCAFFCAARRLCSRTPSQHAPAIMIAATPHATPTAMAVGVEMVRLGVVSEGVLGEGDGRRTSRSSSSLVRFVRWSCLRWGPGLCCLRLEPCELCWVVLVVFECRDVDAEDVYEARSSEGL